MNSTAQSNIRSAPVPADEGTPPVAFLSIVTTAFRSETTIAEFIRRALSAAEGIAARVELIVVDDGSPDRSAEIVRDLADRDDRIVLVQLSRNFGHHRAMFAGLEQSTGDTVFLIDSDLEESPEHLGDMLALLSHKRADCCYGVQKARKGGWLERTTGDLFYWLFNLLSEVPMPRNVSTMRVMTRRYVNSLLRFRDHNPVFVPLGVITGYRQVPFTFEKLSGGRSTYSFRRRISMLVLSVTSFSGKPLSLMFAISVILSGVALAYALLVIFRALTGPTQSGWSSLMASIMLFFSLNALFTGIIGLYLKRILEEIKDRPRTIIQEIYRGTDRVNE